MGRVWLRARSSCTPPFPVCGAGVRARVLGFGCVPPLLEGSWGVCVLVRPSRMVSCTSWLGLLCRGACLWARPACSPPFLAGVCCVGVGAGPGSRLCPALLGRVVGVYFFFRLLAVHVPGLVVSVPPSPLFRGGLLVLSFFAWRVSVRFGRPFFRWAAVPGSVVPVFAGWSLCAPLGVLPRVPSGWKVWPSLVVLAGGVVAVGRSLAPPPLPRFFFWGGLPVPPSAFPGLAHTLAGIQCGLPGCCWWLRSIWPCPGPMGRVGYVHVWLGAPSCRVRSWLCWLGGRARRLRVALG